MTKKKKKDEDLQIFSEMKIAGIVLKPWSFGMLFDISPLLERVLQKATENGLINELSSYTDSIPYATIVKIFTTAGPEMLKIIAMSTKQSEEKIKTLPMDKGIELAVAIFNQNKDVIKNALTLLFSTGKREEGGTE